MTIIGQKKKLRPVQQTRNNTEAHSPSAKFNYFLLTYSYCVTNVCTYNNLNIHENQRNQRSRKGRKRTENDVPSATIY